ncbi:MAG: hypothetical protein KF861_21545 [Planctomycetaceae bacterium]|nr:hypothetical protein [Planctomycetaceae bacterium]
MTTRTTTPQEAGFRVSPRRVLRPGMTFRTRRGSGPTFAGRDVGEFSTFRCLRFYRRGRAGRRLYCIALNERTGGTYDLFLDGPAFTSQAGTRERPYRVQIVSGRQPAQKD